MDAMFSHPRLNEFEALKSILQNERILINPRLPKCVLHYELFRYMSEIKKAKVLVDRNVVSYLVQLISGIDVSSFDNSRNCFRLAAGLQSFLNAAHIESEPGYAFHEYLSQHNLQTAEIDLSKFRAADNLDPNVYLDIALKKRNSIPLEIAPVCEPENLSDSRNIPKKLRSVEFNKVILKKAMVIRNQCGDDYRALLDLIDWMHKSFLFSAPAIHFLSIYFSRRRISKMIKGPSSKAIENAAFDLGILHTLADKAKNESDTLWLLATFDSAIIATADLLFVAGRDPDEYLQFLKSEYKTMWGKRNDYGQNWSIN
ncbi:MAG: hypothetical protein IPK50_06450 [Fibrobacterota bacterium]|nr:MAG: hypothetical protein IPK50_06450 [Fibrobacterota bacterium]